MMRRKGGFVGLGGYNQFFFIGSMSSFQPSLGAAMIKWA
jgi:hypothetical protein